MTPPVKHPSLSPGGPVPQSTPDGRAVVGREPDAPVHVLTQRQQEGLVTIFFAGSMYRRGAYFIAEDSADVNGQTAQVLLRRSLIKLIVERDRQGKCRAFYRYSITVTDLGLWYVNTIIAKTSIIPNPDDFELSEEVYGDRENEEAI